MKFDKQNLSIISLEAIEKSQNGDFPFEIGTYQFETIQFHIIRETPHLISIEHHHPNIFISALSNLPLKEFYERIEEFIQTQIECLTDTYDYDKNV